MRNDLASLIHLVDDDENLRVVVERWLRKDGYDVTCLASGDECLEALSEEVPEAICLDINMPGLSGIETLERIRERYPALPVVVLTADDTAATAVNAMKLGAHDYLTKPLDSTKLLTTLKNAIAHGRLSMRVSQLEREVDGRGYPGIAGASNAMKMVFRQMDRLAVSDVSVLIHGESGTGKELIARAIHQSGSRSRGPFVAVNSAAIPESLLESELFGHEKGSFTGAATRRIGRFEEAHKGTLFLDEIGELSAPVQAKLLRVLQERSFQRVGGSAMIHSDFRLVTATHRNLADDVMAGRFREDLFFRLAVFELELPPLRERKEDIPVLAQVFIRGNKDMAGTRVTGVSPAALSILLKHEWPGNVRELQNVIQRALVIAHGDEIMPEDLPERLRLSSGPSSAGPAAEADQAGGTLEEASRKLLLGALEKHDGNASAAMRELKVGRTRFYRMLKKFGLEETMDEIRQSGAK
ncbi:MAG: sigma-54 dependent transcriptional regulator [Acidobacteria bacterium]|nr:sigma-54 dependent transcriptional regulator [Acidobacteriota bacterium]